MEESPDALERVIEIRREKKPLVTAGPRWWYLAMAMHRLGEHEKALEYYHQLATQLSPEASRTQLALRDEAAKILGVKD